MDYRHGGVESLDPWLGRCVSKEKRKRPRSWRAVLVDAARAQNRKFFLPGRDHSGRDSLLDPG